MERVFLNKELSRQISETGGFIPKHCYDNVFNNIGKIGSIFREEDIKVMFCYVSVGELKNIYARHACFYLDGEAIDPTITTVYGDRLSKYEVNYIPISIMTVDEYFILIAKEYRTDLTKTFEQVEEIKYKELSKHGIVLIG